jgi:hypothetical protein
MANPNQQIQYSPNDYISTEQIDFIISSLPNLVRLMPNYKTMTDIIVYTQTNQNFNQQYSNMINYIKSLIYGQELYTYPQPTIRVFNENFKDNIARSVITWIQNNTTFFSSNQNTVSDTATTPTTPPTPPPITPTITPTTSDTIPPTTSPTTNVDTFTNYKKFQGIYSTSKVLPTDYHPF